ncbi:MAG: OmpA family protein [Deltaproteobacteria bacterium]|nr:OmpA family protein [Deltaproteobacteria bacterium]
MKKVISLLLIFIAVFIMGSNGFAQIMAKTYSVSPFVGLYTFGQDYEGLKNKPVSGLRLGYNITKNWGIEGSFDLVKTEYRNPALTSRTDVLGYRIEALYYPHPEFRLTPYLAVGAGGRSLNYDHELMNDRNHAVLDYGAGLQYFLYSNLALRGDIRHLILLNDKINNLEYTLGATFYFGGPKPAAAPVVVDSDNDGVSDNYDKCPGTPIGVKVDQDGCPLDSDKDGVPDYLDKCPGTSAGVKVDQNGCPPPPPPVERVREVRAEAPAAAAVVVTSEQKKEAAAAAVVAKEMFEKGRATINVEFDFDKADIKPAYDKEIQKFADVMKNYPALQVVIEGHTDNTGKKAYNQKLSKKRANSVKSYLTKKFGIAESRLTAIGYGDSKPIDSNKTKAGRQNNRRVEAAINYMIKK